MPIMKSIKKKRMDQREEMGSLVKASGYAMNAKPNPVQRVDKKKQNKKTHKGLYGNFLGGMILKIPIHRVSDLP